MKKTFLFHLLMLFVLPVSINAQVNIVSAPNGTALAYECSGGHLHQVCVQPYTQYVYDTLGVVTDTITGDIEVLNASSNLLVMMMDSVTIMDPAGVIVAIYNPVLKELKDMNDQLVFNINEEHEVFNDGGVLLGWRDEEGRFYGGDGHLLAEALDIEMFKLAYFFFFANK